MSFDGQQPFGNNPGQTLGVSPESVNTRAASSQVSSPDTNPPVSNNKKRKSQASENEPDQAGAAGPVKKTAHNMIEKRYRTNLNDKIAALRDSVPSLRIMSRANGESNEAEEGDDLDGLTPAHKLNKATVLSKATEYIQHLEKQNKKLMTELAAIKTRLESFEKVAMGPLMTVGTPDSILQHQEDPFTQIASARSSSAPSMPPPRGMIPVPENIMALHRTSVNQPHYAHGPGYPGYNHSIANTRPAIPAPLGQPRMMQGRSGNFVNKLMVGSLAGLMLMEGFSEREQSGEEPDGRGLFAMPFTLISRLARFLIPRTLVFGVRPYDALATIKLFMIIGTFGYLCFPLLDFKPRPRKGKVDAAQLTSAPSLASPVEVRRKAWLTAIQTVWVPRHNFWLEVAALLLKTLKLSTRKLVGWNSYAMLTGITKEQEQARVKAWDIALDAQLTGGDAEISMSRLILTLLASGTLPDTPVRLMLKAVHIRVLLWEVAKAGYGRWYMFEELSSKLARSYWNAARNENKLLIANAARDNDKTVELLPDHLVALLEHDADEVLAAVIIERAYNLAWNLPTPDDQQPKEGMDTVVEDFAISSASDALAAWFSSWQLAQVLSQPFDTSSKLLHTLDDAICTAPPTSNVQLRALVAKAVLVKEKREEHIEAACAALPPPPSRLSFSSDNSLGSPIRYGLVNTVIPIPVSADIDDALYFAKAVSYAEQALAHPDVPMSPMACIVWNDTLTQLVSYNPGLRDTTLLRLAAELALLDAFIALPAIRETSRWSLEKLAHHMRVTVGKADMPLASKKAVVAHCIQTSKQLAGIDADFDPGYVSQEAT
ncbi:hypothetical protein EJ08DRAFT_585748 [Tothia fuscella]|uniref:BHLH domain-containing protein n=1 Tax=Tothia fuscella TaxID=1048955 RepID=A0A9P4NUB5_9PEZI|nr:hypothetical protein EJ08DRAFT_585748 [Tothia fuscella]